MKGTKINITQVNNTNNQQSFGLLKVDYKSFSKVSDASVVKNIGDMFTRNTEKTDSITNGLKTVVTAKVKRGSLHKLLIASLPEKYTLKDVFKQVLSAFNPPKSVVQVVEIKPTKPKNLSPTIEWDNLEAQYLETVQKTADNAVAIYGRKIEDVKSLMGAPKVIAHTD